MIFNRYEVRVRYAKDKARLDGAYEPRFTLKKNAFYWAFDLTSRHRLIFGHSKIEYYVFDRKLNQESCGCRHKSCTYAVTHS